MSNGPDDSLVEAVAILVTAVTMTLDKLDKIADRVADIAVLTEAMYVENMREIREREGLRDSGGI